MLLPSVHLILLSTVLIPVTSELVISPLQARSGISLDLIFLSPGPRHQPLCLSGTEDRSTLGLLVQSVCRDAGFTTFTDFGLVHVDSLRTQRDLEKNLTTCEVSCQQTEAYVA